ncbi:MAG TPA: phage holin family protein, partial [Burkholderiales bacterium]|nr:phage holin family protein [Burkholderiales bacterium]
MTEEPGRAEGLFESLRNLARTSLAIVQTRIEIFASEIDEERTRLARIAVLAAVAALCVALVVILAVFFL